MDSLLLVPDEGLLSAAAAATGNGETQGKIQVINGPMFSGKSTELLRRVGRAKIAKLRCLVVKYKGDVRYSEAAEIVTHNNEKQPADVILCGHELNDLDFRDILARYDIVAIDEGQFFPEIADFADRLAHYGKTVIVAALDADFQKVPFANVTQLAVMANEVTKLTAVCVKCQADAPYSWRLSDEKDVEVIGGADKYIALCRKCHAAASAGVLNMTTRDNLSVSTALLTSSF